MEQYALTSKQKKVLDFLQGYVLEHNRAPLIREIQEACCIASYKSVVDKLVSLERKGYIRRTLNKHRSIRINKRGTGRQLAGMDG